MKFLTAIFAVALVAASIPNSSAQQPKPAGTASGETGRFMQRSVGFSFVPPKDWKPQTFPGQKYKGLAGPTDDTFRSNIVVTDEYFEGDFDEYVAVADEQLAKIFKNYKRIGQKPFTTTDGTKGSVLTIEHEIVGNHVRQNLFLFPAPKTIFVVTCSTKASDGDKFDSLFAAALKTFRIEK